MIAHQTNLLSSLLERKSLQRTLKVVSFVNCLEDDEDVFLRNVIKNLEENNRQVVIFKNEEKIFSVMIFLKVNLIKKF